jgi:hypothetical protein
MLKAAWRYFERRRRSEAMRARFTRVHDDNLWGSGESRSGFGSERASPAVALAMQAVEKAYSEHGVRSLSDIPCGDFNWMPELLARLGGLGYRGFDIVKPVLERNKARHPEREFREFDITTEIPPAADLIFCKDLLNHIGDADVKRAIDNMRRSGSTYLLASNNAGVAHAPLPRGASASRHLDIAAAPFHYRPPLWTLGGYMSFWRLADIGECGF